MSEPVILTCSNGHTFESRVKPGGRTDCSACRREGRGRVIVRRPVERRERMPLRPLPDPDDDFSDDDFEAEDEADGLPPGLAAEIDAAETAEPEPEREAPEPAHPLPGFLRGPSQAKPPRTVKRTKVTAAIKSDVEAKIRFVLVPSGRLWAIRDAPCGSTFLEQEPEISAALAEIVCDSPDLLAWFTGPAGGFMKYFRLAMAVQPVVLMVYAHHVAHAVEEVPVGMNGQPAPDYSAYPA